MILTATDPDLNSATATVQVWVINVEDEPPVVVNGSLEVIVNEDAPLDQLIHRIQAYDPDGSILTFQFEGTDGTSFHAFKHHLSGIAYVSVLNGFML